jgi:CRP-like cAMP-binding protein
MKLLKIEEQQEQDLKKFLNKVDFFSKCTLVDFKRILGSFELQEYDEGEVIIQGGDSAQAFYIIYKGKADVLSKKTFFKASKKISELGTGELFGEMAILENVPRTATVIAGKGVQIFILESLRIQDLLHENPSFRDALRKLSEERKNQ